jgi:hypothetical protein
MDALVKARNHATVAHAAAFGLYQMHLQMLGTHPDYRRLGAAAKLVRWGMERAWKDQVVITLLAGGAGYPLYKSLGFEDLGAEDARVPGEEESVSFNVMVYRPPFRELTPAPEPEETAEEETAQEETVEDEVVEEETEQEDTVQGNTDKEEKVEEESTQTGSS